MTKETKGIPAEFEALSYLMEIRQYLHEQRIRCFICISCRMSKLIDNNGKAYVIDNWKGSKEDVNKAIAAIKIVNNAV